MTKNPGQKGFCWAFFKKKIEVFCSSCWLEMRRIASTNWHNRYILTVIASTSRTIVKFGKFWQVPVGADCDSGLKDAESTRRYRSWHPEVGFESAKTFWRLCKRNFRGYSEDINSVLILFRSHPKFPPKKMVLLYRKESRARHAIHVSCLGN